MKKKSDKENIKLNNYGILLKNIQSNEPKNKILVCFIRGLLIFLCTFGTVGGLVSSFDISYNYALVAVVILFMSLYTAFMYYNKFTFYAGYLLFFAVFSAFIIMFYIYINSGYQAFMNIVFEGYKEHFVFEFTRNAKEIIENRYVTISIAMAFVGTFLALLLNVVISGYMNLLEAFFLTFPLLQIGLYIGKKPDNFYLILLLCGYALIGVFHRTGQFRLSHPGNAKKESFYKVRSRKKSSYIQISNGRSMGIFMGIFMVFICMFVTLFSGIFNMDFGTSRNVLKLKTDEYVKEFAKTGISGLFNRYRTTGGISNGRLGGVSSVRPDYQTDLTVTFVPYSYETIYLPSFTGTIYTPAQWVEYEFADINNTAIEDFYPITLDSYAKMNIKRESDVSATMSPYVTDFISYLSEGTLEIYYTPYSSKTDYEKNPKLTEEYEDLIYLTCLQVPENLKALLNKEINEYILPELPAAETSDTYSYRILAASKVAQYFDTYYQYTMSPGATPLDEDFVSYFISTQKKGFCSHFASAAVLILRQMGIPARYKEGYVIPFSAVAEALPAEGEKYEDWYTGDNLLNISAVVTADVADANAHAWVEIYLDGYGFIPVEVTPASDEAQTDTAGFFNNILYSLFTAVNIDDAQNPDSYDNLSESTPAAKLDFSFLLVPLLVTTAATVLILIAFHFADIIIFFIKKKIYILRKDYNRLVRLYYSLLIKKLNKNNSGILFRNNNLKTGVISSNITPCLGSELYKLLIIQKNFVPVYNKAAVSHCTDEKQCFEYAGLLTDLYNKILYSGANASEDDFKLISSILKF